MAQCRRQQTDPIKYVKINKSEKRSEIKYSLIIDRQLASIAGSVAGAVAVSLAIFSGIYTSVNGELSTQAAFVLSVMGVVLFSILILSISNRIKVKEMEEK